MVSSLLLALYPEGSWVCPLNGQSVGTSRTTHLGRGIPWLSYVGLRVCAGLLKATSFQPPAWR